MRPYGKVQTEFWENPGVRRMSANARLIYLYLLTGPHTTMLGCFKAPVGYIADDLGSSSETVLEGFEELLREGFANYDPTHRFIFVRSFLKFNRIENPNQSVAMMKFFRDVPDACALKPDLACDIIENVQHLSAEDRTEVERFAKPFPKGLPQPLPQPVNSEQGTEKEEGFAFSVEPAAPSDEGTGRSLAVIPTGKPKRARGKPEPSDGEQAQFDAFWAVYPRRVAKMPALEAYLAAVRGGVSPTDILTGAHNYAAQRDGKDPDKTAHAATWLNAARWTDEIQHPPHGGYRDQPRGQGWTALDMAADAITWPEKSQ